MTKNAADAQFVANIADIRKKLDSVSKTFCLAKWLQASLFLQNGELVSCCKSTPHVIPVEEVKKILPLFIIPAK